MKTMKATTATMPARSRRTTKRLISPARTSWKVLYMADGMFATMPTNIMRDMPLPIPRSVICSPSHMRNVVPVVRVTIVRSLKSHPGLRTMASPAGPLMDSRPTAIMKPCRILRPMVEYLVYWVMTFLPCSPSFCSFSS